MKNHIFNTHIYIIEMLWNINTYKCRNFRPENNREKDDVILQALKPCYFFIDNLDII